MEESEALTQVTACISSGSSYKANSNLVFESLKQKGKTYTDNYLKALFDILQAKETPPTSKFYAVYLLSKTTTEVKDEFLATRLARQRLLLDKLFKDVQIDGNKPIEEKGKKFFSKEPTNEEAIIGNNYFRLLLETFMYWSQIYVVEDKKNILFLYNVMYTTLAPRVKFPENFVYVNKTYDITDKFHLIPHNNLVPIAEKPKTNPEGGNKPSETIPDNEKSEILKQILLSVPSGADFKNHSPKIFQVVQKNSKPHNAVVLTGINEVLTTNTYPPTFKFYALLLLVKLTETKNEVFTLQLAEEKDLLKKISTDAAADKEKPKQERGRMLYASPADSQAGVIGSNYHTLVLEAVLFWAQTFKSANKKEPYAKFNDLYFALKDTGKVEFPQKNFFVGKELKYEEDETNKSLSKRDLYPAKAESPLKSMALVAAGFDEAKENFKAAIISGNDYQKNSGKVFTGISRKVKEYITNYMKATTEVLKSKEARTEKFYALYLLLKATETKNDMLLAELPHHSDLLDELFVEAQFDYNKTPKERGNTFFTKNPKEEESRLGHNHIWLVLETLLFWKQSYNPTNKKDPANVFHTIYANLEKKVKFPEQFYYVGKNPNTSDAELPMKFELIFPEDLANIGKPKVAQKKEVPNTGEQSKDPVFQQVQEGLEKLEASRMPLRELLENNKEENDMGEYIGFLTKDVQDTYKNSVYTHFEPLLASKDAVTSEKYVEKIITEGGNVDKMEAEYANYKKGKQPYNKFRANMLTLLEPPPKETDKGLSDTKSKENESPKKAGPNSPQKLNEAPVHIEKYSKQIFFSSELIDDKDEEKKAQATDLNASAPKEVPKDSKPASPQKEPVSLSASNYHASDMVDDIDPLKESQGKKVEESKDPKDVKSSISPKNGGKPPLDMSQGINKAKEEEANKLPVDKLSKSGIMLIPSSPQKTDAENEQNLKNSTHRAVSSRISPSHKTHTEADDMSKSMRLSRVRPDDLSAIESSIRNSFASTGKKPPQFKPLSELQVREELEKEIARLKTDKENLQKENTRLNTLLKQGLTSEEVNADKIEISELKHMLGQSQQRIEALEEHIVGLSEENARLKRSQRTGGDDGKNNKTLEDRIRKLENELAVTNEENKKIQAENNGLKGQVKDLQKKNDMLIKDLQALQHENGALTEQLYHSGGSLPTRPQQMYDDFHQGEHFQEDIYHDAMQERPEYYDPHDNMHQQYHPQDIMEEAKQQKYREPQVQPGVTKRPGEDLERHDVPPHLPENYEYVEDEDEGTERFETPMNDSAAIQTNYDIDWASMSHQKGPGVDPSEYDVEWPARKDKTVDSEWEQRMINTKRTEEPKVIRGKLIDSNHPVFTGLKNNIKGLPFSNDLHSFKISCLKAKCPIFENALLRVGVSSTVVHDHTNHKNMLKLVLYFENKSDKFIEEFLTDFSNANGLNRVAKPVRLETFIEQGKQVKQQLIIAFEKVPFECLQLFATVRTPENKTDTFSLFLPTLITKFMEFKYVNAELFRERWKLNAQNILKTEEISVDTNILKTAYDFKKYFGYLIDLKPMDEYDFVQGKKSIKLGGLFELDIPNVEYLLKINVLPTHQVVFQIAAFESESNYVAFLLQALVFLFKKH